jgi:aspartate aminotransferase-like enzyme
LFVLDCVASGTVWVDMADIGVDVLLSAPQKGWSSTPCAGLVMLSRRALDRLEATTSTSFACDLRKWWQIMQAYENGGFAYHATMPTDALLTLREGMREAEAAGFDFLCERQRLLGRKVRELLSSHGFKSVAAAGFEAPGVVVSYTDDDGIHSGKRFAALGLQVAAGVPLQCDEGADYKTFRLGLFGIDKLLHVDRTVAHLATALESLSMR